MNDQESDQAYKLRQFMIEGLDSIPSASQRSLEKSRALAVSRKKNQTWRRSLLRTRQTFLANVGTRTDSIGWWTKAGALAPLLAAAFLIISLVQLEQQDRISDAAEIDAAVLADELPISAYLDRGFNAFVANGGEE